jgi:hypothetical protein
MARRNSEKSDYRLFFVKLLSKDLDAPVFEYTEVLGDNKTGEPEQYNTLEGDLCAIEATKNEHEGKEIIGFRARIMDHEAKETYIFSASFSWLTRGIIDGLLNMTDFNNVVINVYAKSGKGAHKGKTFHNAWVGKNGEEGSGWKHGPEVLNPMIGELPIAKGETKPRKDYYDVNMFTHKEIEEQLAPAVAEFMKANGKTKMPLAPEDDITPGGPNADLPATDIGHTDNAEEETDDLPF